MALIGRRDKFPRGFLWGSATSAYQVEGGNLNSDWEVLFSPKAGLAGDHYHRFKEDFDLAKSLNQNAHRLSIEWARIEPEKGQFDEREINHYQEVLGALKERGIRPLVTLHHFTNPLWFFKRGGWESRSAPSYFASFVRFAVTQLADLCDFWITVNEPTVYASEGYLWGRWLPGKHDPLSAAVVLKHLLEGHRAAYGIIHSIQPKAKVGLAHAPVYLRTPVSGHPVNPLDRKVVAWSGDQDFVGLNYYRAVGRVNDLPKNDLGWAIYPQGIQETLLKLKELNLPIYITENGIADADDDQRANFIADHLAAVWRA
ncbi:MAG: family 1 glycosylhydrolase, partial [Patescibacteria group bacterium]